MQTLSLNYKQEHLIQTMNERTFKWELTQGLVLELVSLDKEARRDFFKNLPIENVPMGSLMDTSKVEVDDIYLST